MEFYNRRVLLLNEDIPISKSMPPMPHIQNATNSSSSPPQPSPSRFGNPIQLSTRPIFASNFAYAFVIFITAFFFLGFVFLYIRQFSAGNSFRRRLPSSRSVVRTVTKSLPVVSYREETKQVECAICLEEFQNGDTVKVIPYCKHVFHPQCIDTWLHEHVTCPICRCSKMCGGSTVENGEEETVVVPNLD